VLPNRHSLWIKDSAGNVLTRKQEGQAIATAPKPKSTRKATTKASATKTPAKPKAAAKPKAPAKPQAAAKPKTPAVKTAHAIKAGKVKPAKAAAIDPHKPTPAVEKLHKLILKSLDDDKAEDVVSIPLAGKSSVADYIVVASGRSSRQVGAIAEHLAQKVGEATGHKAKIEGKGGGDWVLIDAGDIVVHIFRPEVRGFYKLEKMWGVDIPEPAAA
jgi:ribosome-associated protein